MAWIVSYRIKITSTAKVQTFYMREEYAPNTPEGATRFDTRAEAEDRADVLAEDLRGRLRAGVLRGWSFTEVE